MDSTKEGIRLNQQAVHAMPKRHPNLTIYLYSLGVLLLLSRPFSKYHVLGALPLVDRNRRLLVYNNDCII